MLLFTFDKNLVPDPEAKTMSWSEIVANDVLDTNYVAEDKQMLSKPWYPTVVQNFDGEKTLGELGAPIYYLHNHAALATRSWQMYAESDIAKILINSSVEWIIGKGLSLHAEPEIEIIADEGYNLAAGFEPKTEKRFRIMAKSKRCSHNRRMTFGKLQREIYKHAIISGDCLVVFRYDGYVTLELIDGRHIKQPGHPFLKEAKERGNRVIHGVEIAPSGEHIAYFVQKENEKFIRIEAKGAKTGRVNAVMVYGDEYRIDSVRGVPIFSASIEKMKKMDRYIEAMVGGAEERAKVPWYFFHNHFSTGENPAINQMVQAYNGLNKDGTDGTEGLNEYMDQLGSKIAATQGKEPYNLPIGVDMKAIESTQELKLPDFVDNLFIYICASLSMPYEIALMKFVNSYSASRMASQSWQTIMENKREMFGSDILQPYYEQFLYTQVLDGKIQAEGYLQAFQTDDVILKGAYSNARWIGKNVPQADPSKEAKAEVLLLQHMLSNYDLASEKLGTGDFYNNLSKMEAQIKQIKEKIPEDFITKPNPETDTQEFTEEPDI